MKGRPHESEVFPRWAAVGRRGLRFVKRQSAQIFRFQFVQNRENLNILKFSILHKKLI